MQKAVSIAINGMTCTACSGTIELLLKNTPGVDFAQVNLNAGLATVVYSSASIASASLLIDDIESIGFEAELLEESCVPDSTDSGISQGKKDNSNKTVELTITPVDQAHVLDRLPSPRALLDRVMASVGVIKASVTSYPKSSTSSSAIGEMYLSSPFSGIVVITVIINQNLTRYAWRAASMLM
jgi:copper chaperone CopZ